MASSNGTVPAESDLIEAKISVHRRALDQHRFDNEYGYQVHKCNEESPNLRSKLRQFSRRCNFASFKSAIISSLPILHWLPRYNIQSNLIPDIIAGITVGIMHIPQGMAYASLANLPAVYGLYTSFFPSLVYALFGTSRHISLGTLAVVSLMVGSARARLAPDPLPNHHDNFSDPFNLTTHMANISAVEHAEAVYYPIVVVTSLSFLTGSILILMGIFRLGFLSIYLSDQLVSGYTTGASVMVFTAQVDKVFGLKVHKYEGVGKLYYIYRDLILMLPETNVATLIISVLCMIAIILVKVFINDRFKKKLKMPVPIDLIVIIIATLLSYFCHFDRVYHVKVVGHVPTGLPPPKMPNFSLIPELLTDAIALSIILFSLTVSMAKIFAKRHNYKIDPNQELFAYGMISLTSSLFSSWPAGASLSRSSVNEAAGVKTQLAGVFSCSILLVVLLWLGPLFEALPKCVLAAIIMVALKSMFQQLGELKDLWPISKIDFAVWLFAFLATCVLDVTLGLAACVFFSLLTVIYRSQRPSSTILDKITDTDVYRTSGVYARSAEVRGTKIFRFDSPIYFANADIFMSRLYEQLRIDPQALFDQLNEQNGGGNCAVRMRAMKRRGAKERPSEDVLEDLGEVVPMPVLNGEDKTEELRLLALEMNPQLPSYVIIDASGVNYVDVTGIQVITQVHSELKTFGIDVLLANCKLDVRRMFETCQVYQKIPKTSLYLTIEDAVVSITNMMKQHPVNE